MGDEQDRVLDGYLVVLAQGGSREAFNRLARRWSPRIARYATRTVGRPELALDIVQETWMGVIRGLRSLTDPSQFPAWIYGIARRRCIDAIRARQRNRRLIERVQAQPPPGSELQHDGGDTTVTVDLAAAIAVLNEEQREVVHLFYGEELSVQEIGLVLAVPAGTVKSRLYHARESAKRYLGE